MSYPIKSKILTLLSATLLVGILTSAGCNEDGETDAKTASTEMADSIPVATQKSAEKAKQQEEEKGLAYINQDELSTATYNMLAANMLERIIKGESIDKHLAILKDLDEDELDKQLDTDEKRLGFWINIYNGYTQYFLKKDPTLYKNDRNEFFKKEQIEIAGETVAMNDIEHGVLRRGATIWSKGNVRIPFRNDFVRTFKVDKVDYRIHFALNCGAKSCPPVSVYLPEKTDAQLDAASKYYLNRECKYDKKAEKVEVPALMNWFSDDFSSGQSKTDILVKYDVIPKDADPKIDYLDYDWTMMVENYRQY